MGPSSTVKNGINRLLSSLGYAIVRVDAQENRARMDGALRAIARRKHSFNTAIDVGASNGSWSRNLMKYYPEAQYLLIEAQEVHAAALKQFAAARQNVQFILAAAGEAAGQIYFDAADPFGGQASHEPYASNNIQVRMTTIDDEIAARALPGPYLLKFDTHGFEVPILKGAARTLKDTAVIVMECYNFKIAPDCLLFPEMCEYLKVLGFRCIDLVDPLYRPHDNSFWQMDLVFVRADRPEFSYQQYK